MPRRILTRLAVFVLQPVWILTVTAPETIRAHGGKLDSLGCHNHRKQGDYHCHRGELAGRSFPSKADAERALGGRPSTGSPSTPSTVRYDRNLYGGWIDQDGDCQNTRHEVLIAESTTPVTLDRKGCRVVSGRWEDPYTGRVFIDPRQLDIDHFIPLAEVHRSGGHAWTPSRRRQYANDLSHPDTLIAVWRSANRSKGAKDPPPLAPAEPSLSLPIPENVGRAETTLGVVPRSCGEPVPGRQRVSRMRRTGCAPALNPREPGSPPASRQPAESGQ